MYLTHSFAYSWISRPLSSLATLFSKLGRAAYILRFSSSWASKPDFIVTVRSAALFIEHSVSYLLSHTLLRDQYLSWKSITSMEPTSSASCSASIKSTICSCHLQRLNRGM